MAVSDCDGFRLDTVKHLSLEDARNFCGALREFADRIGKRNFLIVGEMAGGDEAQDFFIDHLAAARRNLSAALDIGGARLILTDVAKGLRPAADYFGAFDEASRGFESHRAFGDRHVSILDDHDHVFGRKLRFSAEIPDASPVKDRQIVAATAIQLFALGIPCLYYGSEQAFAGPAASQVPFLADQGWGGNDRYLREAMFGPAHPRASHTADLDRQILERDETLPGFGPFGTFDTHAFDPSHPAYRRIAALCATRAGHPVLRAGRQYQRAIRVFGDFVLPAAGELIAWSRILDTDEAIVLVNPNGEAARGGQIVVSSELSRIGDEFLVVANTAEAGAAPGAFAGSHPAGSRIAVRGRRFAGEPAFVTIDPLPPAEVLILVKIHS
jgi:glycosidase